MKCFIIFFIVLFLYSCTKTQPEPNFQSAAYCKTTSTEGIECGANASYCQSSPTGKIACGKAMKN